MDLKKFLPSLEDKKEQDYFWALALEPGWVQAGIWKIEDKKAEVVYTSPPSAWQGDDELLDACDAALSNAIQDFPGEFKEPSKTVFGVSYAWVSEGEITKEYLGKIKKVCKELSLTPVGFVVLPEAISHLVKSEEGSPFTGIVIGAYKENLEISLFELGKLSGTTHVARSISIVDDAVEGLTRLSSGKAFPSRILIYDGKEGDLEEAKQSLISASWDKYDNLKFLHTPKIELVGVAKKVNAVALAGASEIGDVAKLETSTKESSPSQDFSKEEVYEEEESVSPQELGFVLEKDINEEVIEETEPEPVSPKMEMSEKLAVAEHENIIPANEEDLYAPKKETIKKPFPIDIKAGVLKTFSFAQNIKFRWPSFSGSQKPLLLGIIFFLLIIVGAGLWWWFYPTATVTIYVAPQKLEEKAEVTVATDRETSLGEKVLSGSKLTTMVSGEKTKDTTGSKTVGDKAKGEITIYRVGTSLSLSSGTIVYGPQSLKYVMDNSVEIASGSASSPSETKVSVVAESIGTQYNLAQGSTFTVGNYSASDMEGKNGSAFAGGSSREISAVAKEDQESLKEELEKELVEKAMSELSEKVDMNKYFIKESEESTVTEENFNHKVGDEANTLKLALTLSATGIVVNKNELTDLSKEVMKEKVPGGFILRGEQITYSFDKKDGDEETYKFEARISANLLPEVKTEEIAKQIAGKYPEVAEEYLSKDAPGFVRAEIKMKYALPGKLKTLPHVPKNIEVEVAAER